MGEIIIRISECAFLLIDLLELRFSNARSQEKRKVSESLCDGWADVALTRLESRKMYEEMLKENTYGLRILQRKHLSNSRRPHKTSKYHDGLTLVRSSSPSPSFSRCPRIAYTQMLVPPLPSLHFSCTGNEAIQIFHRNYPHDSFALLHTACANRRDDCTDRHLCIRSR